MATSRRKIDLLAATALGLAAAIPTLTSAAPLYGVTGSDGVTVVSEGYSSMLGALDFLKRSNLIARFQPGNPAFDPDTTALLANVGARGLAVNIQAPAGSTALTMTIPSIHFTGTFNGQTRDESLRAIWDWFKKNSDGLLGQVAQKLAALSPVDPLAGNPNSAQARTAGMSFERGFERLAVLADASTGSDLRQESTKNANTMSVGARYHRGMGTFGRGAYTLPLGYGVRFNDDVRHQLSFDLPISYESVEGGRVYGLGLGVGYSHPITSLWVLTAGVDYAVAESTDLGTNGHVVTGTLTSMLTVPVTRWLLAHVGNMVGQSSSLKMPTRSFASDPGIKNTVIKNGLMLYFPTTRLLRSSGVELFAMDTRFFGTRLYDQRFTEIGLSYGFSRLTLEGGKRYDSILRIGATALIARGNNDLILNMGYYF